MTDKPFRSKRPGSKVNQELLRRTAEFQHSEKILAALYEIATAVNAVTDMQEFYAALHRIVGKLMYAKNFYVSLYDPISQMLSAPYFADEAGDTLPPPAKIDKSNKSLRAYVLLKGKTLHVSAEEIEEGRRRGRFTPMGTPAEDWVGVPLKTGGQVIGSLTIQSYEKSIRYGEADVQLLEFVAQHIAVALTRARAIEETRQRNAELQIINSVQEGLASKLDIQAIYELIGEKVREVFNVQVADIVVYDPTTNLISMPYSYEKGDRSVIVPREPYGFRLEVINNRAPLLINQNFAELASQHSNPLFTGAWPKSAMFVPLLVDDNVKGIISIQDIDRENAYSASDVRLLQTLANAMSIALENARLFDETQHLLKETEDRAAELAVINSVQGGLASKLEMQAIYDLVGGKIREIFDANAVTLVTFDLDKKIMHLRYAFEKGQRNFIEPIPIPEIYMDFIRRGKPLLINNRVAEYIQRVDPGFKQLAGEMPRSVLAVPLTMNGEVRGLISLQNIDRENAFTESDVRLLQTLANSMSIALENARLWEQEKLYRKALEREFKIGREIQAGFLPDTLPQPKGWEIAASLKSAREVAGDFYDVFELPDEKIGLVIADVCDKGLGAALFMTLFRSLIRAISNIDFFARVEGGGVNSSATQLKNAISLTNNYIAEIHGDTGMFATVFFGILDPRTGVLTYINGGHLPPMLVNAQGVKEILKFSGPAVGALADANYVIKEAMIEQGESFFAYTDGLTDTANPEGKFFSEKELPPFLIEDQPLSQLLARFQKRVTDHAAGAKQYDDITMLAARRLQTVQ